MISAGAPCVGVGSAIFYRGENAFALSRTSCPVARGPRLARLDAIRGRTRCAGEWRAEQPAASSRWENGMA